MQADVQTESGIVIQATGHTGLVRQTMRVFIDGKCVGIVKDKNAHTFPVPTGPHRVMVTFGITRSEALEVSVPPGERVELECGYHGGWRTALMVMTQPLWLFALFMLAPRAPLWVVFILAVALLTGMNANARPGYLLYLRARNGSRHLPGLKIVRPLIHRSLDSCLGRICVDLDDFDAIVKLLRRDCRSVRVVAQDVRIDDSSQLERLVTDGKRVANELEIEAHDPFLRIRFDPRRVFVSPVWSQSEVIADPNDSVAAGLHAQLEGILKACRRRGPRAMLAGLTEKGRRACLFAVVIAGLIIAPLVVVHASLAESVISGVTDILAPTFVMFAIVTILLSALPCAPVLLLGRGRTDGRMKLEAKPGPIAEL